MRVYVYTCMQACIPACIVVVWNTCHNDACKNACLRTCIDMHALQHIFMYAIMHTVTHKMQKMYAIVHLCTKTCMHEKQKMFVGHLAHHISYLAAESMPVYLRQLFPFLLARWSSSSEAGKKICVGQQAQRSTVAIFCRIRSLVGH